MTLARLVVCAIRLLIVRVLLVCIVGNSNLHGYVVHAYCFDDINYEILSLVRWMYVFSYVILMRIVGSKS